MTREQWSIMNKLYEKGGICQQELSDYTLKDKGAMTRILNGMEERGLVVRQVNLKNRRSFAVYLTGRGKKLRQQIEPIAIQCLNQATVGLTTTEIQTLKILLRRVSSNLE
nr:MarR family transcriptional regulator [Acetonema longum]